MKRCWTASLSLASSSVPNIGKIGSLVRMQSVNVALLNCWGFMWSSDKLSKEKETSSKKNRLWEHHQIEMIACHKVTAREITISRRPSWNDYLRKAQNKLFPKFLLYVWIIERNRNVCFSPTHEVANINFSDPFTEVGRLTTGAIMQT